MAYNISIVTDILEAVNFLSESAQCRVLKAALAYLNDQEYELNEAVESVAYKMLIPMLSTAKEKSKSRAEKMRENGKKGGRKKTNLVLNETKETNLVNLLSEKEEGSFLPPSSLPLSSPTPPSNTLSYIPPIIPQEENVAHVREEDFGLQVGVIAEIEKYEQRYKQENMWKEVACQNHITLEQVHEIFSQFIFTQKHNANEYPCYAEFKKHFLNYLRKRAQAIWAEKSAAQEKPKKVISGADIFKVYG